MVKARVFISHSAGPDKKDAHAREILLAIRDRLQNDFCVLLDEDRLKLGAKWRGELVDSMWRCQAAIILVSESALTSPHVLMEVAFLNGRKNIDPTLLLIPVLVAPVKRTQLEGTVFSAIAIKEFQMGVAEDPAILDKIAGELEPIKSSFDTSRPLDTYERWIAEEFRRADLHQQDRRLIEAAIAELRLDVDDWRPRPERDLVLARLLLASGYPMAISVVEKLAPHLQEKAARLVAWFVAPLWVDQDAAARLGVVARGPNEQRAIGLTGRRKGTGDLYVRRACLRYPSWEAIVVNPPQHVSGGSGEEWLSEELKLWYQRKEARFDVEDDELIEQMRATANDEPLFVIVPEYVEPALLKEARNLLPTTTFIVLLGHDPANPAPTAPGFEILQPVLTRDQETQAHTLFFKLERILGRLVS